MTEAKRKELKQKIAASQARNDNRAQANLLDRAGEKAIEAKDKIGGFVREHPVATVVGVAAVGILLSGLFKRSPTRKLGEQAAGKAASLAAIGAELALAYAQHALTAANEAGRVGAEKVGHLGETLGETAHTLRREAAEATEGVRAAGNDAAGRIARAIRNRIN